MSAYIVCTDERKRDVNHVRNDLKQKLQYRAQCVKERWYSNRTDYLCSIQAYHIHINIHEQERERAREG